VALQRPTGVAVGPDGSIWIVDANLGMLIHVGTDGVIAQVVSGLIDPEGVAVAPDGTPYVAEPGSYRVASIGANGKLTTVAGNPNQAGDQGDGGLARRSLLLHPQDVATDGQGNLFIADAAAQRIRLVASATGKISTVAGNGTGGLSGDNGPATSAQIYGAQAVAIDAQGTRLLIADTTNHRLRQVDLVSGVITSIAGAGDTAVAYDPSLSGMQTPLTRISALALDPDGNAYFPVFWGNLGLTVMRMDANGKMARVLGGGPTQAAGTAPLDFALPDVLGLAIVPDTGTLLVCGSDGRVYSVPNVVVPI
jgi:sugar lactone lactonase YvrE